MTIKTFYCLKLVNDNLRDDNGNFVPTVVFKYCNNCLLTPDSTECNEHREDVVKQTDGLEKYWIDWRNHPKYNTELVKDIDDIISLEMIERMSNEDLCEFGYLFSLKCNQSIYCSKIGDDIDRIIDRYLFLESEYQKVIDESKKRGFVENVKDDEFSKCMKLLETQLGERKMLEYCVWKAQTRSKIQFVDKTMYD